jgi:YfiH family protein
MKFLQPSWPAPRQIRAYTTVRESWGKRELDPWDNASQHTLETLFQIPAQPVWLTQTHSTIAIEASKDNMRQNADASYTAHQLQVCAVLTADCLPLLICNKQGDFVAAIHAGWRGLAGGVIESTLQHAPSPAHDLLVWLGPAIGPQKFEVGRDVFDAFTIANPASARAFVPHTEGKWLANLYELARIRLEALGVKAIYGGDFCTYTQQELFYSYRRDQGKTGRMASLIWIEE